ncbi:hypothetical protein JCM16358_14380 [Halanaerocella petrolearia]
MSKSYIDQTKDDSKQIDYQRAAEILNNLTPKEHGVLLDCILPQPNSLEYPDGIAKPIAFLEAVNLEDKFMIIMVEYKLHFPAEAEEREIALEVDKSNYEVFKKSDRIDFIFADEKPIEIKLHNSFDFPYELDSNATLPTYPLLDWAKSPFI